MIKLQGTLGELKYTYIETSISSESSKSPHAWNIQPTVICADLK